MRENGLVDFKKEKRDNLEHCYPMIKNVLECGEVWECLGNLKISLTQLS